MFDWVRALPAEHGLARLCDSEAYTTMIALCGPWQQLRRALQLIADMRAQGIECGVQVQPPPCCLYSHLHLIALACPIIALGSFQLSRDNSAGEFATFVPADLMHTCSRHLWALLYSCSETCLDHMHSGSVVVGSPGVHHITIPSYNSLHRRTRRCWEVR